MADAGLRGKCHARGRRTRTFEIKCECRETNVSTRRICRGHSEARSQMFVCYGKSMDDRTRTQVTMQPAVAGGCEVFGGILPVWTGGDKVG